MTNPREVRGQIVYSIRVRDTAAGKSITIPADVCRYLGIKIGDSMTLVLLDDGFVVSKLVKEERSDE